MPIRLTHNRKRVESLQRTTIIFLGGGLGAVSRYWLGYWIQGQRAAGAAFPWHTLIINVTGSLIIGLFYAFSDHAGWSMNWRLFVAIGILGGYTTFSSFSYETVQLILERSYTLALGYILGSFVLCILAAWLGVTVAKLASGAA